MGIKKDSVAKGGSSVAIARVVGMALSFLLFIMLARQSPESAGTFKTVLTYIMIAEFLGMLGLHRWLAAEISTLKSDRWPLFLATNFFTLIISLILAFIYIGVALSGIYDEAIKVGLLLGVISVIPSAILGCIQSTLVGVGQSHFLGKLNLTENLARCSIAMILIWLNQSITMVIGVFVVTRWIISIYGFLAIKRLLSGTGWHIDQSIIARIKKAAPKFALIMGASLVLRNAGILAIPALSTLAEAGRYAVAYQLYDLMLVLPSVLAMTTINLFSNKAVSSMAGFRKVSMQLTIITAIIIFPLIAITSAFSEYMMTFIYGAHYNDGYQTLVILMLAAGFSTIGVVLSQMMQAIKEYDHDLISILIASVTVTIATLLLTSSQGANGAAIAITIAIIVDICVRLYLLKTTFPLRLLLLSIWRPLLSSTLVFIVFSFLLNTKMLPLIDASRYHWMVWIPIALTLYFFALITSGAIKPSHRNRVFRFLRQH